LAGAMAGMTECSVNTPFEVVKVQLQAKEVSLHRHIHIHTLYYVACSHISSPLQPHAVTAAAKVA
jgi:Mitochondrial carrier protein